MNAEYLVYRKLSNILSFVSIIRNRKVLFTQIYLSSRKNFYHKFYEIWEIIIERQTKI